jgi:Zn-dependent metalloprotease
MKNHYYNATTIFILSLFCSLSFGQVKQITPPNIKSPFQSQSKKVSGNNAIITPSYPTAKTAKPSTEKLKTINGSFMLDFKNPNNSKTSRTKESRTSSVVSNEFGTWFDLNEDHTFQLISEKEDELKITHSYYQQYYKGFLVQGSILMLHSKEGLVDAANGQVAEFASLETQVVISTDEAKNIAKFFLKVTDLLNEYPVETLIAKIPNGNGFDFKFAHKIRIDSSNPFVQKDIYLDAKTGKIINVINLTSEIDTPATVSTIYSGTRTITTDSYSGGYRLRDNLRKIETYDSTNSTLNRTGSDFSNTTTTWNNSNVILSFVNLGACSTSWWLTPIIDDKPEFYIKVKDASNLTIYNGNNEYLNNLSPPLIFKMNSLNLSSTGTYTIELWEYNTLGSDDFGGSFQLNLNSGSHNWSVNGNNGTYNIVVGNPAYDIHWGMEKAYDFYKNIFTRTSYNNAGAIIKNYVNPIIYQLQKGYSPNNASADRINDVMYFGFGDGIECKPIVDLDVMGHEFTHLVVKYRGNPNGTGTINGLEYEGESGALNESFADIFGTCLEFEAKPTTANWTIGEDSSLPRPSFIRSMSDPKSNSLPIDKRQPNTYQSPLSNGYWDRSPSPDVHINSGVQNYWFYLLSQGGSGTNDLGNIYSVTGIGINKARQIAYDNLTTYLGSNIATYNDSFNGSLLAAEALYGNPSSEYTAVRNAWYAVGIPNNSNSACGGTTNLTDTTGTFSDGSGKANYENNGNCTWVISPAGATQVSINFTEFDTEANNDKVYVYDGADDTAPLLATWWGNTLPPTITTSAGTGAMCIKFISNSNITASGWTANYTSLITPPTCSGVTLLSTPTGTFSDGSGANNYTNNQQCFWYIAPPCATSVTLSFSQLNTELDYDGIAVYDSLDAINLIGFYSGTTLPASINSNTGSLLVVFMSDYINVSQGFTANYTSTGSSYCSGVTTLNTSDYGTITDGSGANNYCNNSNCSWLIQPPQATSVTFNFTEFELESASTDGNSIYDAVEIFDGTSASAPLLGRFTGSTIPTSIISSGGSMFIRFYSDVASNFQGWSGYYTSTQNGYCDASANTLTTQTGTFTDGSGANKYSNNADCSWLIQPANASTVTLSFSAFDTELNYDGVIVYDGANNSAPVLGIFTGTTIPSPVKSTGGSMYVSFLSDEAEQSNGWDASYSSTTLGVNDFYFNNKLKIYPNPTNGIFTIQSFFDNAITGKIYDVLGKEVLKSLSIINGMNTIDIANLPKGIYLLKVSDLEETKTIKVIKE